MFKPLSFPVLSPCSTIANLTAIEIEVHTEQSNTNIKAICNSFVGPLYV
jgi:hypothetical protein